MTLAGRLETLCSGIPKRRLTEARHFAIDRLRQCAGHTPCWFDAAELAHLWKCPQCSEEFDRLDEAMRQRPVRALTLYEPWATLMAHGLKRFEFRTWVPTREGKRLDEFPLAIHAGKTISDPAMSEPVIQAALAGLGIRSANDFRLGHVIGMAWVAKSYHLSDLRRSGAACGGETAPTKSVMNPIDELACKGLDNNACGWHLVEAAALIYPLPARGYQGLWDWQPTKKYLWFQGCTTKGET